MIKSSIALCLFLTISSAAVVVGESSPPNIVFLFADDQTSSSLGCYGHPFAATPNIDSLASRGTRFQNSFVSHSICWVSRSTILTGRTGRSLGDVQAPDQPRPELTQAFYIDILRQSGYRTAHFGKWHTKLPKGNRPQDHFSVYEDIGRDPYFHKLPDGSFRHETDLIVDRGIEFLKSQPKNKPFAMNLWFNACHAEDNDRRPGLHYAWPPSANGLYEGREMPPAQLGDPFIFDALPDAFKTSITRERYFWRWNSPEKYQINMRAYYRMVSGIDNAVGRLLAVLQELGLADNTIIVYSADNGYHMATRGLADKWSHFDESLRVPLIVCDPRVAADQRGKVSESMVLNLDLPSTFLDWAGVPVPDEYQGRSLKSIIDGSTPGDWRQETFHEHFAVRDRIPAYEGVRTSKYKYARYFDHDFEMLHDLEVDPDELTNLAEKSEFAGLLEMMRKKTDSFVAQYGAPFPPSKNPFVRSTDPHPSASASVALPPGADGFSELFNGKDLKGWAGDKAYWSVEDGAITGRTDGSLKMNRFLTWKGSTVRNFDLRVKVKVTAGGNSGLQYRGKMLPEVDLDIVSGYQCDIVANVPNYNGMLYEERGRRILSHTGERVIIDPNGQPWIIDNMPVQTFAPDEWHDYRVLVEGNHHQHWIDNHMTADLIDFDEKGRSLDGVLGVQVHVGPAMKIQFKDFRIKFLPDEMPLKEWDPKLIPVGSLGVKPQGKLPADWKPPVYSVK